MTSRSTRTTRLVAGAAALALALSACGGSDDTADADAAGGDGGTVTLGYLPSWTDGLSTSYLWQHVLEERGYDVEMQELSEAGLLYAGLAGGDVDVYPSAWPEVTHADYMDEYGDDIEDLGAYYQGAVLTLAVPEYTDIDSIADLAADPGRFDGQIYGIEPGAGLTRVTRDEVMPAYGLEEDYQLVESSTTAMLAQLQSATDAQEDIVVTLWRPFWANSEFPVKDLADPEGALGDPEGLHELARSGFGEEFPEVADLMGSLSLDDEQYGSLEDMVVNEYGDGRYEEAVEAWLDENPDVRDSLLG
ncbi:glycine betaine ABC transporter substrate-binding protein [Klenkia sp. PcliD-1-E]|uniref:glycine betaine ABC transporter substrate-binding protein n=1 Tax=Klenkia sp. PcliD-1-E TaxID=2954492 RepID=UPI0020973A9D|nr:glycine betaine ABC transporter substrate-binding protein [Klenkia sp. PcliD-1-E]MCO7219962.1 glycine betaine ABC transporter substrate-binding protein [Klenkia sp. PcliD-1-E]